jgi:hemerythrin
MAICSQSGSDGSFDLRQIQRRRTTLDSILRISGAQARRPRASRKSNGKGSKDMTELVVWNDELSVGIEEIDEQHKVLVQLLNELSQAIKEHHGNEACLAILDRLVDYTRIHFAVEESLMRIFEYEDYENHKAEHEQLIEEVVTMRREIEEDHRKISFKLLHFLKMWLTQHIMSSDKEYSEHFLNQGMKQKTNRSGWFKRLWG